MRISTLFTAGAVAAQAMLGAAANCRPSPPPSSVSSATPSSSSSSPAAPTCTNPSINYNLPSACTEGTLYGFDGYNVYYAELCAFYVDFNPSQYVIAPIAGTASLRSCMSACAVRPACKYAAYDIGGQICYLLTAVDSFQSAEGDGPFDLAISHDMCPV